MQEENNYRAGDKVKVLIVDDVMDVLKFLTELIKSWGYEVKCASSGNEALSILRLTDYDVLLTDVKMKDGDGMFLFQEIKKENMQIPVKLVMTGYTKYSDQDFLDLGAKWVFQKPIDTIKLKDELRSAEKLLVNK